MKTTLKTMSEKEAIVAEYLLGELSYRSLGKKHGVDFRILHSWVKKFQGTPVVKSKKTNQKIIAKEVLSDDVKTLQEELRKAKLYNELLNTIIDIAEDQLKINIRKKSGTKQ
jgi:transposase-like protein